MNKLLKCQLFLIGFLMMSFIELSAQISPTPYLGLVTMNNGWVSIDWTIEAANGNNVVLKNDQGYVKTVIYSGNQYTSDKNAAMKFFLDDNGSAGSVTVRSTANPDSYYTHKGGNYVMHAYIADRSNWSITPKLGIDPTPFLGDVNMKNRTSIDWTIESAGGNHIVLKNGNGYVKNIIWNGNDYTSDKSQAMKFVIDNGNSANTLRSVDNPDAYYTHKGGNNVMHAYMHDGSLWVITKR